MQAQDAFVETEALAPELPHSLPPVEVLAPVRKQITVYLLVVSLFTVSILSTAAAEIDIQYLLICYNLGTPSDQCFQDSQASKLASTVTLWSQVITAIGGILIVPHTSALSDKYGRKPVLYWCLVTLAASRFFTWYLVFGTSGVPHYYWLLVSGIVASLGGSVTGMVPLAISYVSDLVTDPVQRAQYVSFVDAAVFIAIGMGPTIGSRLILRIGLGNLYLVAVAGCLTCLVLAKFVVRESLKSTTAPVKVEASAKFKMLLFNHIEDPYRRRTARIMAACSVLGTELIMSLVGVLLLYVKHQFNWSSVETGYLVTLLCFHRFIAYAVGFPNLHKWMGRLTTQYPHDVDRTDVTLMRLALGFCVLGFSAMAFAPTALYFVLFALLEASASYGTPIFKAALLKYAPDGQFGTFMASLTFVTSLGSLFVPAAMIKLYGAHVDGFAGVPFLLAGGLFLAVFLLTFAIKPRI